MFTGLTGLLVSGLLLIGAGMPIAIAFMVASIAWLLQHPAIDLMLLPQRMAAGPDSFTLLAVPLFLLAGSLMNAGGLTERLVRFADVLVGHIRGGLGHVVVVSNVVMAGISGSATADAAGTGSVLIPTMQRGGYSSAFSAAVVAAAATIGPIIPPSIVMVVYAGMTNVSIGYLFLAGVIPGLIMGAYLMLVVWLTSRRRGYLPSRPRLATFNEVVAATRDALPALVMPVLIVAGILGGIFTPTEAAGVAVLYALLVGGLWYRQLTFQHLGQVLVETLEITGVVMFVVAAANVFSWILISEQGGVMLKQAITSVSTEPAMILLIINLLLLVAGCFMDSLAILLLTAPILAPLVTSLGIDPIHFGLVMVLNLQIALVTPPVGVVMYVVSSIAKVSIQEFAREVVPFLIALIAALLTVTYWPQAVLLLPRLFGYR